MTLENETQLSSPLLEISKTIEKLGKSLDTKISPYKCLISPPSKTIDFKGEFKKHVVGIHVPANIRNPFRPWPLIQRSFTMQGKHLYSEVSNKRACSLNKFEEKFHPAHSYPACSLLM